MNLVNAEKIPTYDKLIEELQHHYLERLTDRYQRIKESFANGDTKQILLEFKQLKGSGASYGIPEISELSAIITKICVVRPQTLRWVIPLALDLLNQIYAKRSQKEACFIQTEEKYHEILLALGP